MGRATRCCDRIRQVSALFLDAETSLEPKAGLLLSAIREPRFLVGLVVGSSHHAIPTPRACGRQTHRDNIPFESAEEYYRRLVFLLFIEEVLSELCYRFLDSVPEVHVLDDVSHE